MSFIGAVYFQAEKDDDELMYGDGDSEATLLSWRGDAEETHSDWTIVINDESTYHVHKNILAVGAHCCMYFKTLFATNVAVSEQHDATSRITLENTDQAAAFPIFLDFVYSTKDTLEHVTTRNAVALRSLARYFRCPALIHRVNAFIESNLNTSNAITYLEKAHESHDVKLEESTRRLIAENYRACLAVNYLPFELFCSVVSSPDLPPTYHAEASSDACSYFEANPDLGSASHLNALTSNLTEIHPHAADCFLKLIAKLDPKQQDEESWLALDKLVQLCSDSLASDWKNLDAEKCMQDFQTPSVEGDYHGSGRLVISRLTAALKAAKADSEEKAGQMQERDDTIATLQQRITTLRQENAALRGQDSQVDSGGSDEDVPIALFRRARRAEPPSRDALDRQVRPHLRNEAAMRREAMRAVAGRGARPNQAAAANQQEVVNLDSSSDSGSEPSSGLEFADRAIQRHQQNLANHHRNNIIFEARRRARVVAISRRNNAAQQANHQAQAANPNDDSSDSDSTSTLGLVPDSDAESSVELQPPRRRARR